MQKLYFYIATTPPYRRKQVVKVGITDFPAQRLKQLQGGIFNFSFLALFKFYNPGIARELENNVKVNFGKDRLRIGNMHIGEETFWCDGKFIMKVVEETLRRVEIHHVRVK